MSRWRDRVVPDRAGPLLVAGILMGIAHPPFHLIIPSFVALVPVLVWLERLPSTEDGRRQARIGGFFFGLVYYTLVFYWLLVALIFYTWMAILAFLAPILIMSMFMSWITGAIHAIRGRLGWPLWILFPVFWTANEWLRASLGDVAFPWMQLGDTLTNYPALIGAAELVGSRGISMWLALANALIAVAYLAYRKGGLRAARGPAIGLLVALVIPIGYSVARWQTIETRPVAAVGVVQPNVPQHIKIDDPGASTDSSMKATQTLTQPWIGAEEIDLLLMPETTLLAWFEPIPSERYVGWPRGEAWVTGLARSLEADVAVGAMGADDLAGSDWTRFNSAFHFTPADGRVSRYDKRFLVPLVERVPFVPPEWLGNIPYMSGNFGVGDWAPPIEIPTAMGTASYGTMICYESIFSPLARHYRLAGADFLVNLTNDSWFGRDSWWSRSSGLAQHPAHLVMRAIETRMGIARSANTGVSFIVDPLGRVSNRTELFTSAAFTAEVRTTDIETLYVRFGDVAGTCAAIAAILALCASIWRARNESRSDAG